MLMVMSRYRSTHDASARSSDRAGPRGHNCSVRRIRAIELEIGSQPATAGVAAQTHSPGGLGGMTAVRAAVVLCPIIPIVYFTQNATIICRHGPDRQRT